MARKKADVPLPIIPHPHAKDDSAAVAAEVRPAAPALPELPAAFVPIKDAVAGMYAALDGGDKAKFALHTISLLNAVVQLVGGDLKKMADMDLEVPTGFFDHLPNDVRALALASVVEKMTQEAEATFKK